MNFVLAYPSRSRPDLFQKRVLNWSEKASGMHKLHWCCSFDIDDPTMNNPAMQAWCTARDMRFSYGNSKGKVEAINATMKVAPADWDIVIIVSDDMAAMMDNWDCIVADDMLRLYPNLNGGLWYLDGRQDRTCTLSIMGRPVYEEFGHLYNPAFISVYCDNFYHDVMQHTGRLARIDSAVFCHEWGTENKDELMLRNESADLYKRDRRTYETLLRELKGCV